MNKKKNTINIFIKVLTLVGVLVIIGSMVLITYWLSVLKIPSINNFDSRQIEQSTKIYDRTGKILLFDLHNQTRRTLVPFDKISNYIKEATITIEDDKFYSHHGIRPIRILKAVFDNVTSGNTFGGQGGSTITQQVIKNVYLTREKTITRKIKEWILAIKLEKKMDKKSILNVYLNEMPYGGNIYGVEEASKYFFGKSAIDVTLAESAYIAALPQRPTYLSPYGKHKNILDMRQKYILKKMFSDKIINKEQYDDATNEDVTFIEHKNKNIIAPHFVFFIRDYLYKKYGSETTYNGGLKVITTLNTDMQEIGERIIKKYALMNEKKFNAENATLVALDPKTGQILSMVGSRDYFDEKIDGKFNVAIAHRQPGSTFKPIVYSTAFELGYPASTILFDLRTQFSTNCLPNDFSMENGCYSPVNYDGKFRGPMTLRNALAQSVNIPAVKLLHLVGIDRVLKKAKELGINSLQKGLRYYGLSLVLGGGEVTPLELTGAYGAFANDGEFNKPVGILKIEDSYGNIIEEYKHEPKRVLTQNAARVLNDVLSDNVARTPSYGRRSFLYFDNWDIAAKTGTTNDFRDVWVVGYTPTLVVGTWAGNNNNSPIVKKVAGFVIAPMWRAFMDEALHFVKNEKFKKPLPVDNTIQPILLGDWNKQFLLYGPHSILQYIDKDNPLGQQTTNPLNDTQYQNWEYPIQLWLTKQQNNKTQSIQDIGKQINIIKNKIQEILQN